MRKNLNTILIHGFILSLVSALITLLSLFITNKGFYIFGYKPLAVILSFLLVLGCSLFIYTFSNIVISVFFTFNLFYSLSLVSLIKYEMRNIPAVFTDVFLVNEVNELGEYVHVSEYFIQILILIIFNLIFIAFFLTCKRLNRKANLIIRSIGAFVSILLLIFSFYNIEKTQVMFKNAGPIYVFSASIWNTSEYALTDAEEASLLEIIEDSNEKPTPVLERSNRPNIIIIMNEAFWDIDQLPGVTITPNPYEIFGDIKSESLYGRIEVPVFAGGTCNTEFEVLSSISTHMYEEGLMVFNNEIQEPIITLASILRNQGYHSVGLHPFWGWYYNRNLLYSHLGFNNFITSEHISDSKLKGYYISDDTTTDVIIEQIESVEEPLFLYAVTMQNHGPYDDGRFDNQPLDIEIEGESLDETDQLLLEVYGQGIYDAVNSLDKLINYLRNSDEETIILFFGDHLPLMGTDLKVYKDTAYLIESDDYIDKHIQMRTTPFILWSNRSDESQNLGVMDAIFMGPYLLDKYKLDMPDYYRNLLGISKSTDFVNPVFLEYDGRYYYSDSETYKAISDPLIYIQKDIMYGEKLYEKDSPKWLIANNSDYNKDLRTIIIENVYEKDEHLVVSGENIYSKGILTINGKAIDFTYKDGELWIPLNTLPDKTSLELKMELFDTYEESLAKSNTFEYTR